MPPHRDTHYCSLEYIVDIATDIHLPLLPKSTLNPPNRPTAFSHNDTAYCGLEYIVDTATDVHVLVTPPSPPMNLAHLHSAFPRPYIRFLPSYNSVYFADPNDPNYLRISVKIGTYASPERGTLEVWAFRTLAPFHDVEPLAFDANAKWVSCVPGIKAENKFRGTGELEGVEVYGAVCVSACGGCCDLEW
jgi:hypothetical protein